MYQRTRLFVVWDSLNFWTVPPDRFLQSAARLALKRVRTRCVVQRNVSMIRIDPLFRGSHLYIQRQDGDSLFKVESGYAGQLLHISALYRLLR
jgi:hypothetical protein